MVKSILHHGISFPRRAAWVLAAALAIVSLAGCGKSAQERQQEYYQKSDVLNSFDNETVLAGRDPASVLVAALSAGGCVWLEKGFFSGVECWAKATGADYDPDTGLLRLEQYSEYPWGLGKTHRTTAAATIPVDRINAFLKPPNHSGPYQCWDLKFSCREGSCVEYEKRYQLIGKTTSDEGGDSGQTLSWHLPFSDKRAAIEACAALRVLSGQKPY